MSSALDIVKGSRVDVDLRPIIHLLERHEPTVPWPRKSYGTVLGFDTGHRCALVRLASGGCDVLVPLQDVRLAPRPSVTLTALEDIPAGAAVEIDPASGNVRRLRS